MDMAEWRNGGGFCSSRSWGSPLSLGAGAKIRSRRIFRAMPRCGSRPMTEPGSSGSGVSLVLVIPGGTPSRPRGLGPATAFFGPGTPCGRSATRRYSRRAALRPQMA
jgi:hypothetical protein